MIFKVSGIFVILFLLSACSSDDARLRDLYDVGTGPEEFAVLPSKPLKIPNNLKNLPVPDTAAGNLADPTPKRDLIVMLGGSIDNSISIPEKDKNLLKYVSRAGVDTNIREELAEEDRNFLRRMGVLTSVKLFRVDRYNQIYRKMTLSAPKELERWRSLGVRTPSMSSE
tara:strand:+ start:82 stop:588 length:507 start_codon:yes stop_codon:yes gene_type:complete